MDKLETIYDVLNHFKNTKRRLTQGGDSDFITIEYKQLLALIELAKREQQELSIANDKLKKIEEYCESTKEKYKYYNECNTTDVRVISKIIKGED